MKSITKSRLTKILVIVITIILVYILLSQIKFKDIINIIKSIDPIYLIIAFSLYVISYFFRALRFRILLNRKIEFKDLFTIVCIHNMANNILPMRTGELSYIYLLKKLHNKSTGEGIATLFVARVFDFISICLLFFISGLTIQNLPDTIIKSIWFITVFMVLIVFFLVMLIYFGERFVVVVEKIATKLGLRKKHLVDYLLRKGMETVDSFKKIEKGKTVEIFLISMGIWLSLYSVNYILVNAMGINLTFCVVLLGSTFSVFTTVLPIQGMGGFGTYESAWAIAFISLGITKQVAITSGFGIHILCVSYFLILGSFGLLRLKFKK